MGQMVIAAYRPKPGRDAELVALVREHLPVLREQGLVTDRAPVAMRARDGTILEVFEWKSAEAIAQAHENEAVMALWGRFSEVCDYETLASLPESRQPFAPFETID